MYCLAAALPVLQVGWAETDYFFTCMDYSTMMADLNSPAGNCSLSAAGAEALGSNNVQHLVVSVVPTCSQLPADF